MVLRVVSIVVSPFTIKNLVVIQAYEKPWHYKFNPHLLYAYQAEKYVYIDGGVSKNSQSMMYYIRYWCFVFRLWVWVSVECLSSSMKPRQPTRHYASGHFRHYWICYKGSIQKDSRQNPWMWWVSFCFAFWYTVHATHTLPIVVTSRKKTCPCLQPHRPFI